MDIKYEAQALKAFQIKITLLNKHFLGVKEYSLAFEHLIISMSCR